MYSSSEYVEMIILFGECGRNAREAAREYRQRFPERNLQPDHKTILNAISRAEETGNVTPVRSEIGGAPRAARTVEREEAVLNAVEEDGTRSLRSIAQEMNLSRCTVQRILKENRKHPFHYIRVQHLKPEDYPIRRAFCLWLLNENDADGNFVSKILFSDESMFHRQGSFNHHNLHIWAEDNPRVVFPRAFQNRFAINLWAGILGNSLVGPFEFPARLSGARYEQFIRTELPELLDEVPLIFRINHWFQHDGAPPHFTRQVREHLNNEYPQRWIGRGGPRHWPARSPDLNPLDFFLWGHVKDHVYRQPINSELELRARLEEAFASVTPDMIANSKRSLLRRAHLCIEMNGGHFQHLL